MADVTTTAQAGLVINGSFDDTTNGANKFFGPASVHNSIPTGWTVDNNGQFGFGAIYASGSADSIGGDHSGGRTYLWGPNNPLPMKSMNGLSATSPFNGGNYLALDGDHTFRAPVSQFVNLEAGKTYELSFEWAAAQFRDSTGANWNGATDERFQVTLGNTTKDTDWLFIDEHGFSGWKNQIFTFTAASTGPTLLSFLADSTAHGLPPVALLDGVSLSEVPEPTTVLFGLAIAGFCATARRRA